MRILIAVPVFNEEKYVVPVMREIRKYARAAGVAHGVEMKVLVVDDGSTDGTAWELAEMCRRGQIEVLTHAENRGYGQSLIDAFGYAAGGGYDWVITMDCDEQHEPCRVPLFVKECVEAQRTGVDIVSGTRYLWKAGIKDEGVPPADRRNINKIITDLLNSTLNLCVLPASEGCKDLRDEVDMGRCCCGAKGAELTDAFCGFKAHRVGALKRMNLTVPGYAFPMQFWAQAASLGLVIKEMPVKLIYMDATRHFGGMLDDPTARLHHYMEVLTAERRVLRERMEAAAKVCGEAECLCE